MSSERLMTGMRRGIRGRCPNCGKGRLFRAYLKVESPCPSCGNDNGAYRADDLPAYLTILLVGHLVVTPLFLFPVLWERSIALASLIVLPLLTGLCLLVLPWIKGAVVGLHWAQQGARISE